MKNFVPVSSTPQNKWKNFFRNLKADTKVVENLNRIVSVNETKFLFKNLSTKKPSHMALLVNSSKHIMKKKNHNLDSFRKQKLALHHQQYQRHYRKLQANIHHECNTKIFKYL